MMVLDDVCSWINQLWVWFVSPPVTICNTSFVESLPDHIMVDILIRLPVKHVSICRMVCKKWLELTSMSDFVHDHIQRQIDSTDADKVLLLQCRVQLKKGDRSYEYASDGFFVLKKGTKGKIILEKMLLDLHTRSQNYPFLYGSCNGLLVFKPYSSFDKCYIFNPSTHERINIRWNRGILCGLFYHQSSKEYRLLFYSIPPKNGAFEYFLFSLEIDSLRFIASFPFYPSECPSASPVFLNGVFHWLVDYRSNDTCDNSIMTFNVETEGFNSFLHPGSRCNTSCNRKHMQLLEISGQLCFSHKHIGYIDIWILEDTVNRVWAKNYVVHLQWDQIPYPRNVYNMFEFSNDCIILLNIENGELLLYLTTRGLFMYNLDTNKVRKIDLRGMKLVGKLKSICSASVYSKSLVSLKVPFKCPVYGQPTAQSSRIVGFEGGSDVRNLTPVSRDLFPTG